MRRCVPIIIIVCILLSGCGLSGSIYANYRAIEALQPVQTLGLDRTDAGASLTAAVSAAEDGGAPTLLHRSGGSIRRAMDALQNYTARGELFFAHTQSIVLGTAYAEAGIRDVLDFAERDQQMRLGTAMYVMRSGDAEALLTGTGDAGYDVTEVLAAVKRDLEKRGDSHVFSFRETAVALSECGAALICALCAAETEGSIFPETEGVTAVPAGYGILRGDRLAGFLTGREAEAARLLTGNLGTLSRSVPDGSGGEVTLEYGGRCALTPQWNADGSLAPLRVEAKLTAALAEPDTGLADAVTEGAADALSAEVEAGIRQVLALSQALDADFLGLTQILRRSSGENFAALPDGWLQALEFDVRAETELTHSYDLGAPVRTEGVRR